MPNGDGIQVGVYADNSGNKYYQPQLGNHRAMATFALYGKLIEFDGTGNALKAPKKTDINDNRIAA